MAIAHEPKPRSSALDYVPQGSTAYKVTSSDSWRALAERREVKAASMSASDLCHFNFRTRKPSEINWYLYHKVGCRKLTRDGRNYMFRLRTSMQSGTTCERLALLVWEEVHQMNSIGWLERLTAETCCAPEHENESDFKA